MSKVAVALSGGIDSAVVALLLLEQGYEVIGITGKMTCSIDSEAVVKNAKQVADNLGIKHYVVDVSNDFSVNVIDYFENSYKEGLTPNPCIMCNKHIKWGCLFDYAIKDLGADFIATGHYANIKKINDIYKLYPAIDEQKDQLYFLYLLTQEHLAKTIFPLSKLTKTEVKDLALKYDLPPKSAKESQDICFIKQPMTTKKYLNNILQSKEGVFVQKSTGKLLGKHSGYWQFTVGQRKGIGIAAPYPLYVLGTDAAKNIVYLGYKDELYRKECQLNKVSWNYSIEKNSFEAMVKVRYNMQPQKALVTKDDESVFVQFYEPVSGIAPGQSCVFYDIIDGHLLGGGII